MDERTINNEVTMGGAAGALLVGRYRVVRPLGQGGMGSVWLAEDAQLENRQVAIKMLPSILVSNKRAYNQLKAEALVSLKLSHPNIAAVRAFEENAGNPFLVVDYVDGQTLDDYLAEKGRLSEEEAIRLLTPVAAALDYAHGEGVVHRDVKPANVMIRKDGHPFALDFGIAREIQETLTRVTGKLSSGTLLYMSPEQLNGDAPTPAQDVYSFAAMAYECLTGAPPFVRGLVEDQIKSKIPDSIDPHIAICGSVMAGLAKSAEARPASCAAVLKRVEGLGNRVEGLGTTTNYVLIALLMAGLVLAGGGFWWYSERKQDRIRQEAESARQKELVRMAEEKRIAEEKRRVAEEERRIAEEEQRIAKEKTLAEEKRCIAAEKQRIAAEERRIAEERRAAEEKRIAEEKRATEEKRAAEEKRLTEERSAAEVKSAEDERRRQLIVGRWQARLTSTMKTNSKLGTSTSFEYTLEFRRDGTVVFMWCVLDMRADGCWGVALNGKGRHGEESGRWRWNGNILEIHYDAGSRRGSVEEFEIRWRGDNSFVRRYADLEKKRREIEGKSALIKCGPSYYDASGNLIESMNVSQSRLFTTTSPECFERQ